MYNGGKGQVINRAEFLRWKYRDHKEVVIPIEASLTIYDPLGKWQDHKACWQMQYRGALGESLLHVLIICDTKVHTKLSRVLLRVFPKLSLDVLEGEEYLGASALHLAIAYSNNELVADLIEAGADINQRAIGSFFLPYDQQKEKPAKNTDYEGLAYMGEYPLSWAACCANESVYNLLMDYGADPDMQDSFGNMILHMVVVCDKLDMFGYALRHPKTPARNGIPNNSGFTPLTLACQLGRAEVFREMLELSAKEFWRYSNITCSGYSLNALDTLLPDGRTSKVVFFLSTKYLKVFFRLGICPLHHSKWYQGRAFGHVGRWNNPEAFGGEMEDLCPKPVFEEALDFSHAFDLHVDFDLLKTIKNRIGRIERKYWMGW